MRILAIIFATITLTGCWFGEKDQPQPIPWEELPKLDVDYNIGSSCGVDVTKEVGHIWFFVFDESGKLVTQIKADKEDIADRLINAALPDGKYTISAWGTDGNDLIEDQNGYRIEGSTLGDFRVILENPENFDKLFHAETSVTVKEGQTNGAEFDFTRQTHILNVTVSGVQHLPDGGITTRADAQLLDIYVEGKDGAYSYDGKIADNSPINQFRGTRTFDNDAVTDAIPIQRLVSDFHDGSNAILLHIKYDGEGVITPVDILETIEANPNYNTQTQIDIEHEYNIELEIQDQGGNSDPDNNLVVKVIINGFVVNNLDVDVVPFLRNKK